MLKSALTILCALLLLGCSARPVDPVPLIQIEGLVFENQAQIWISAVRLLVPVTGNFVSCGNISPQATCSTTFPEVAYTGNPVEITWSQNGQIHSTGQFVLQLPDDLDEDRPVTVHVVITGPGSAGTVLIQH